MPSCQQSPEYLGKSCYSVGLHSESWQSPCLGRPPPNEDVEDSQNSEKGQSVYLDLMLVLSSLLGT